MASTATLFRLFTSFAALVQANASFSLDISGPSWDYTTKDLADKTSQACKDAYSAIINCDETLLKIVASMDPDFNPQPSDLQAMCTTTCSNSLTQYVKNVNSACDNNGDLAGVSSGNKYIYQASVATVGEVFQYKYGQSCATNGPDYCYLTYPNTEDWARTNFPCSDECAVKFYQNAHEQSGSAYFFDYFALCNQSSWWETTFAGGWETVTQCGDGSDVSSAHTIASSTKTNIVGSASSSSSISTDVAMSTSMIPTTAISTATPVRSAEITSTTATSGASRVRAPLIFIS